MALLGIDVGGTKIALSVVDESGRQLYTDRFLLKTVEGDQVTETIKSEINRICSHEEFEIQAIGISIPGISDKVRGTIWAPNIKGWDYFPLKDKLKDVTTGKHVTVESDRTCYILGEIWKGNAIGTKHAIYLSIGTGIGAGIYSENRVLHGAADIAGAVGWIPLPSPLMDGAVFPFEHFASGKGMVELAGLLMKDDSSYQGKLVSMTENLNTHHIFENYDKDQIAEKTIRSCIRLWGMGISNLVSTFNPEVIVLGGGVFGPGLRFLEEIKKEADFWSQPISARMYQLKGSALGGDAGVIGAAYAALLLLDKHGNEYL